MNKVKSKANDRALTGANIKKNNDLCDLKHHIALIIPVDRDPGDSYGNR